METNASKSGFSLQKVKTLILALLIIGNTANSAPHEYSANPIIDRNDLESVKKYGGYLFKISNCRDCHTEKNGATLAGGSPLPTSFGVFYGPNITADKVTGIGNWSDNDFIRALRRGVSPNGRNYFPAFPYSSYTKFSDADILALKSYIFSLPVVKKESKRHEVSFPFNVREFVNIWKVNNFLFVDDYTEDNFIKARGPYENIPTRDSEWNRGAYLVEGAMHCTQCHSPRDKFGNFKWNLWMSGAPTFGSKKSAPNITPSKKLGTGNWTTDDWELFLIEGTSPNGTAVVGKMKKFIEDSTSHLSRRDMRSVIKYLMSIRPVEIPLDIHADAVKKESL